MVLSMRLGALARGLVCSFEFKLEGGAVTYLVLAAPVIAGAAASIPVLAEATWRERAYLQALLWWAALVPAGAVVFFSAAERVHVAQAGAQAERVALRGVASRAQGALTKADAELVSARAAANQARGLKKCGPDCRSKLAAETTAQAAVDRARGELLQAEKQATTDSPYRLPCGFSRLHSTWWGSSPSGRGSHMPDPNPLSGSPERRRDGRSAERGHPERPVRRRWSDPRTTTPTSSASTHAEGET
jgi:hypothetical protein